MLAASSPAAEIIMRYRDLPAGLTASASIPATPASPVARARTSGLPVSRALLARGAVLLDSGKVPGADRALLARLRADPDVLWAAPNRIIRLAATVPADPDFPQQWSFRNTGQSGGVPGADVAAVDAWDVTTGTAATIIAVVDTGAEPVSGDLSPRFWTNIGETPGNGVDDDGNGFVDDIHGWNFADGNADISPAGGSHGTFVAGLACAVTSNGLNVAGLDWNARLMPVKTFGPSGTATEAQVCDGMLYAARNGARIVNASFGDIDMSPLMIETVAELAARNVLLVAAAGNDRLDGDVHPFFPAAVPYDNVLSVGASDMWDAFAYNNGSDRVHLAAPGVSVISLRLGGVTSFGSGTSYAAPHAAGIAGLAAAVAPSIAAPGLRARLMSAARPVAGMAGRSTVGGVASASGAVAGGPAAGLPGGPPAAPAGFAAERVAFNGALLRFTVDVPSGAAPPAWFAFRAIDAATTTGLPDDAAFDALPAATPGPVAAASAGFVQRVALRGLLPGHSYRLSARAMDRAGRAGPVSAILTVAVPALPDTRLSDSCDTTTPLFTPTGGFALTSGSALTGANTWQDSPDALYAPGGNATLTSIDVDLRGLARPRLSYAAKWLFPRAGGLGAGTDRQDGLRVEASPDGGTTWRTLRTHSLCHAPTDRQWAPLDALAGQAAVRVRFRMEAGFDAAVDDGVYLDDIAIHEGAGALPESTDTVLEPRDFRNLPPADHAGAFTLSPEWTVTPANPARAPRLESFSAATAPSGSAGAMAGFFPFVPEAGPWEVFVTWGPGNSATGVRVAVSDGATTTVVTLAQDAAGADRWRSLGVRMLPYGKAAATPTVAIEAGGATGPSPVTAGAVRLRWAGWDAAAPTAAAESGWELYR